MQGGERYSLLPNLEVDARDYDKFALELARDPSLNRVPAAVPPGFVAVVAAVYATVGHSIVAAKTLLWFALVAATVGAAMLARRVHGTAAAGWVAAFLTASSPALQAYTGTLQYEVLVAATILLLAAAALAVAATDRLLVVLARALLLGIGVGFAVLLRETVIALVPVIAAFVGYQTARTRHVRAGLAAGALVLAAGMLPVAGWSVIQSRRTGHAMLVRDNVPGILPFGHNPYANGTWNVSLQGVGAPAGLEFIRREPGRELWLLGRKCLYFWGILRDGWNVPRPAAVWASRASGGLAPLDILLPAARGGWILLALILACISLTKQQWRDYWLLPALIAALMSVHLVTIASHRFAVPILPLAFVLIGGVIARAVIRMSIRHVVAAAMFVVFVVVMQTISWPVRYRLDPTELDGENSENRREPDGRLVRFSDAARGRRVAFALYDEYLPSGPLVLRVRARRADTSRFPATPIARVRLFSLDGGSSCETLVTVAQMPSDRWTDLRLSCRQTKDGPARLIAETLGRVDLSFSEVSLRWLR